MKDWPLTASLNIHSNYWNFFNIVFNNIELNGINKYIPIITNILSIIMNSLDSIKVITENEIVLYWTKNIIISSIPMSK